MADSFLLQTDDVSKIFLVNGIDFLILQQDAAATTATLTRVFALYGPQLGGQTQHKMIGY